MKVFISRDQAKGLLGRIKFELKARAELTGEEANLVKKYQVENEILLKKEMKIPFTGAGIAINLTIGSLMAGQTFTCSDIAEILEYEKNVKFSCEAFKNYLEIMRSFGGQEVIEYK
jgi:hypothetical protein